MNSVKKLIVLALSLALILPSAISPVFAASQPEQSSAPVTAKSPTLALTQAAQPEIITPIEIKSKRTANAKIFSQPGGTKQMEVYASPIHYATEENNQTVWKDIDSNFKKSNQGYENTANSFSVLMPEKIAESAITIKKNNLQLELLLEKTPQSSGGLGGLLPNLLSPTLQVKGELITYGNVRPGVDFRYQSLDEGVKEEIILNSPNAQSSYVFNIQTTGVTAQKQDNGSILFIDNNTQKTEFLMPPMVMWDSRGGQDSESNAYSNDIAVDLKPVSDGYQLTITPSLNWLKNRARIYPVILDPTIIVEVNNGGEDTYVEQNFPDIPTWDQKNLYVGNHTIGIYRKGIVRTLIAFPIPDLTDANIIDATFTVSQKKCDGACPNTGITAHLTSDYNPYTVTWDTQPAFSNDMGYRYGNPGVDYSMNVTAAAKHWYEERNFSGSKIGALGFKFDNENQVGYQIWKAKNDPNAPVEQKPRLIINYRDYDARYDIAPLIGGIIDNYYSLPNARVTNAGRNTWSTSDTHLSYHIYTTSGQLVTWDGERSTLPRDVNGHYDAVALSANFKAPSQPGDYIVKWDMVQEGVTWFSEQGVPMLEQTIHIEGYPLYSADYNIPAVGSVLVDGDYTISGAIITNTGRKVWSKSDTNLSYHLYDTAGNLVTFDGVRTNLPRDVNGLGDAVTLDAKFRAPSAAGDYIIKWDLVQEGVTWFSEKGVLTRDNPQHVDDYPLYAARYNVPTPPPATVLSNGTITIPMSVTNLSRQNWPVDSFQVAYHWIENATGATYIYNGLPRQSFAAPVARRDGTGAVVLNVKAPLNAGVYTLKIDMVDNYTWFSAAGVPTADFTVTVTNPAFSSEVHLGSEKYYTKAGPVDLATGNLAYSSVDMTVPSNSGLLAVGRSYNSVTYDNKYNLDASGYIHNWVINGPYRENDQASRLSRAFIPVEANVQPSPGSTSANNLWVYASTATPVFDINATLAQIGSVETGYGNNATAYTHAYIYSPTPKTYALKVGSADGVKIWVNGTVVLTKNVLRALTLDSDTVNVNLNQGWNRLLFKIAHASGQWALSARLLNLDATVPSDLIIASGNQDSFVTTASMGQGWRTNFDEYLNVFDADNIFYQDGTGAVNIFTLNPDGTYRRPAGVAIELIKNADGSYTIVSKSGLKTNFNSKGQMLNRVDLSNNKVTYSRDINGNVTNMTDGARTITLAYTGARLDSITNQLGQTINYTYDTTVAPFRLTKVTDPLAGSYTYEYTPSGKLSKFFDKKGNPITVAYDLNNRVVEIKDALGSSGKIAYNNKTVTTTDPMNRVSQLTFDNNYLMTDFTNAKGYREIYGNDGNYNVVTATPDLPENEYYYYKYSNTYDANDNLLVAKDPMDNTTTNEYAGNDLVKTTDPKGNVDTNAYSIDGRRLLLSQTDANLNVDSFVYDAKGRVTSEADSKGALTTYTYTTNGDVATLKTPKKEPTTFTYDTVGRKVTEKSALLNTVTYAYDNLGRLSSLTDAGGLTSRYEYDANSNKTKEIDPKGSTKTYEYDALNRQTKVIDEAGAVTAYQYDAAGNATKTIDAKGKETTLQYDALDQVVKQTNASGVTSLEYDRNSNVVKTTDPKGTIATQTTDKNGLATAVTSPEGTTTLGYDQNSNLISSTSTAQNESVALAYDKVDNLTSLQSSVAGNNTITYDKNDNPVKSTVSSAVITTTYDLNAEVNQISTKLTENNQTLTNVLTKDAEGKLVSAKNPNGDITSYTYDVSGRVVQVLNKYKLGATQQQVNYTYDPASNITSALDSLTGNTAYTYDARNQLLSENDTTYTYDVMGNRLSKVSPTQTFTYTYDELGDANRLTRATNAGMFFPSDTTFEYDQNGNIIKKISNTTGTTQYFYDSDDYFIKAILPNETVVEYTYDKLAKHRISRTETKQGGVAVTTKYVYDGDKLVSETKPDGKIVRAYTWDEDENLFSITLPDTNGVLQTYYYLKNGHSDITGLTDANGTKIVIYDYDAWGNITTSGTIGIGLPPPGEDTLDYLNPRLYAGYWFDRTLGLYFMKARMYDPTLGRFLSKDPIQVGDSALDANPYIYTANNPLTHIDPSGKYIETALDVAGLAYDINAFRKNRTLGNAGFMFWSAAAVAIPIVPGSYAGRAVVSTAKVAKNSAKTEAALKAASKAARSTYDDAIVNGGSQLFAGREAHKAWTELMKTRMPGMLNYNKAIPGSKLRPDAWINNMGFELKTIGQASSSRTLSQVGSYERLGVFVRVVAY